MKEPKISIITPSYNQGQFLERTILSVLNQNYRNYEYIIIDGGSTDNTINIIKKYEKYLKFWISEPDRGQADAINKGFSKSEGEIIAWINSDDMYLPDAFRLAAETYRLHPDASIIYGDYIKVDADDKCIALRRQPSFDYRTCLYGYLTVMQPASFFQKGAYLKTNGLDTSFEYSLDYDLIVNLATKGKVIHIRKYLAAFRLHPSSKSVSRKMKFYKEDLRVRNKYRTRPYMPCELSLLFRYYQARVIFRMLKEGCLPSRFGWENEDYKTDTVYSPQVVSI